MHLVHSGPVVTHRLASGAQPSGQQVCTNSGDISAYAKTRIASLRYRIAVLPFRSARAALCAWRGGCRQKGPSCGARKGRGRWRRVLHAQREDPAAIGQRGISKTRSYPLRITPCRGATPPDRAAASFSTLLVPARGAGLPIGGGRGRACAHHFADLTDREAATAWGRDRPCANDQADRDAGDHAVSAGASRGEVRASRFTPAVFSIARAFLFVEDNGCWPIKSTAVYPRILDTYWTPKFSGELSH